MDNFLQKLPSFVRIWLFEYIKKFATIQGYYSTFKNGFIFKYNPEEALKTG